MTHKLILGSGSPRRLELLAQLGVTPDEVRSPDIDETPVKDELPRPYCQRMALEKVEAIAAGSGEIVLSADTTVALGRRILGKPENEAEAAKFLLMLSGRRHRVVTAIAVKRDQQIWQRDVVTAVKMASLSDEQISAYVRSGEWQGKAGGYTIQGRAGCFVAWLQGSYSAVVGLPLVETYRLLTTAGLAIPLDAPL